MNDYVAVFHTHCAALQTGNRLLNSGLPARMMPVPRVLSASCGTSVWYQAEDPLYDQMDPDVEAIYMKTGKEEYRLIRDFG